MKELCVLFFTFAKIGSVTFGGGTAMLPLLQCEVVEKKKWVTNEEITDYYAIGRCTPGVVAVNAATFVGQKRKGAAGGVAATLGLVFPAVVIITVLAGLLRTVSGQSAVRHAFGGIRACVCAMILSTAIKLWKSTVQDQWGVVIFACVLAGTLFTGISPILFVLASAAAGVAIHGRKGAGK